MRTLFANAYVVTMDDAGTELSNGWILVDDGFIEAVGEGNPPPAEAFENLGGALITPGLVNTHHHLYQTLTRTRAQQADLFTWLRELYPLWSRVDRDAEYAAARTGLAALALGGCTTAFDHHYVFPRGQKGLVEAEIQAARELGVRLVAPRRSHDLGGAAGGLPPPAPPRGRAPARLHGRRRVRRRPPARRPRRGRGRCPCRHGGPLRAPRVGPRRLDTDRRRALLAFLRPEATHGGVAPPR